MEIGRQASLISLTLPGVSLFVSQTKQRKDFSFKKVEISRQATLISLTLPGATYLIRLAFALINALAKRQASKPSRGKVFH